MLELPNTTIIEGNAVRWGSIGEGPPLVAIHGTPFSSQVWRMIAPQLADRRTVYYFDLVGYGLSEMREGQDVSLAIQNRALAALFKEWGFEQPDVLAHDFGGATALRGYYLNGLRYGSLTIFDAVALAPGARLWSSMCASTSLRSRECRTICIGLCCTPIYKQPHIIRCQRRPWTFSARRGSARSDSQHFTGKLRRWISDTQMRSKGSMISWTVLSQFYGGVRMRGFHMKRAKCSQL